MFDRQRHPFHKHAEVELFLAWREDEPVGRVAAIDNWQHVSYHQEQAGFFGFFESVNDIEVAQALLERAAEWVKARGREVIRGPMSFSTNEEVGLLVEGFGSPPVILYPYNPPYYPALIEACGLEKARDLLAYHIPMDRAEHGRRHFQETAERLKRRGRIRVRTADIRRFDEEVQLLKTIYNQAWSKNWGFVPMTDEEIDHMARELRPLVQPELVIFAEVAGEPAGVSLSLPDYYIALRHINGRLTPLALAKLLWYTKVRKIRRARLLALGVVHRYQRQGVDALLLYETLQQGLALGYREADVGWVLEDNVVMNNTIRGWGVMPYKRFRVYEKVV